MSGFTWPYQHNLKTIHHKLKRTLSMAVSCCHVILNWFIVLDLLASLTSCFPLGKIKSIKKILKKQNITKKPTKASP